MRIDVLTLFPEMFPAVLGTSILRIARENGALEVATTNIRDFSTDKHRRVDDTPYGGGPGMVLKCEPVFAAVESLRSAGDSPAPVGQDECSPEQSRRDASAPLGAPMLILLTPDGERLSQPLVQELAAEPWLALICGRYEGFDERIRLGLKPREISIGDYVLSGGELAAMVVIDAVARLLPGVLSNDASVAYESFSVLPGENAATLLDCPHYTRPLEFRGMRVPDVLTSGDHEAVARWRREQAHARTLQRRPDLLIDSNDEHVAPTLTGKAVKRAEREAIRADANVIRRPKGKDT